MAQSEIHRHADQPSGPRRQDPCEREDRRRPSRSIHRTIGNNSSFGGNSLVETIGLLDSKRVAELVSLVADEPDATQTFRDISAGQTIEIVEGSSDYKVVSPPSAETRSGATGEAATADRGINDGHQTAVFCYNSERWVCSSHR